ncbi:myoglobin [Latimeria chalumnae]|uniref:myoglobin n=1 Tax=Latimeria chalumnae TaxID=7897 RepID=UPI0006D8D7F3|nr:PREDICTED: myoglobin [Latimeria chalumnae]|eukprot:XP_006011208.2 PREDICTED: myoglobin [Latimeria chalumnae]
MALSEAEWGLILKVWGKAEPEAASNGKSVLLRMFQEHPDTQQHFPKFKHMTYQELQSSEELKTHGDTVLSKLGCLLKLKGNHAGDLHPLAQTHATKHKIPLHNFEIISEIIVKILAEKYPGDFGADGQAALKKALSMIIQDMGGMYKEFGFKG